MRRSIMRCVGFILLPLFAFFGTLTDAKALEFDLNYIIQWDTGGVKNVPVSSQFSMDSFGTIELTDANSNVKIEVQLVDDGGPYQVHRVLLDYDDDIFNENNDFDTTDTTINAGIFIEGEDSRQADGYTAGYFDLEIPDPPPGSLGTEPYEDWITLSGFDLNPSHFDFLDSSLRYLAAVHIGGLGAISRVPEPATILLIGTSLVGFAGAAIRKKLKK